MAMREQAIPDDLKEILAISHGIESSDPQAIANARYVLSETDYLPRIEVESFPGCYATEAYLADIGQALKFYEQLTEPAQLAPHTQGLEAAALLARACDEAESSIYETREKRILAAARVLASSPVLMPEERDVGNHILRYLREHKENVPKET